MGAFETQTTVAQGEDLERLAGGAAMVGQGATEENLDALFGSGEAEDWQERAYCMTNPEAFFPRKGESRDGAKRLCGECTVRAECLEYALLHDQRFGIWGGKDEAERSALAHGAI